MRPHSDIAVDENSKVQRSTTDTEGDIKPSQQDVMVDGIKCRGQVEQGEDRQVAIIDCIQNLRQ